MRGVVAKYYGGDGEVSLASSQGWRSFISSDSEPAVPVESMSTCNCLCLFEAYILDAYKTPSPAAAPSVLSVQDMHISPASRVNNI